MRNLENEGPVYAKYQRQSCDVSSDITLIEFLRFLINQMSYSKFGLQP